MTGLVRRGSTRVARARAVRPARPGGEPSGHWGRDRRRRGPGRRGARGRAGRDRGRTAVPAVDTPTRQAYVRAGLRTRGGHMRIFRLAAVSAAFGLAVLGG